MGMKFLNKKGWHTGSLRNIENVWKAEQKDEAEKRKLEELRKQIHEEKERDEFRQLQEQAGFAPRQERLEFLYDSGLSVGKTSNEGFSALQSYPPAPAAHTSNSSSAPAAQSSTNSNPGALFEEKPQSANDSWRKLHSDPLLMIRQREQEALARIKNNPVKMAMIRKSVEAKKKDDDDGASDRKQKKVKSKYKRHSSSKHQSDTENDSDEDKERKRKANHKMKERVVSDEDKKDDEAHDGKHKKVKSKHKRHSSSKHQSDTENDSDEDNERKGKANHKGKEHLFSDEYSEDRERRHTHSRKDHSGEKLRRDSPVNKSRDRKEDRAHLDVDKDLRDRRKDKRHSSSKHQSDTENDSDEDNERKGKANHKGKEHLVSDEYSEDRERRHTHSRKDHSGEKRRHDSPVNKSRDRKEDRAHLDVDEDLRDRRKDYRARRDYGIEKHGSPVREKARKDEGRQRLDVDKDLRDKPSSSSHSGIKHAALPPKPESHRRWGKAPQVSEEERAARLREMQTDAEIHEENRWKRLKKAEEEDAKEASKARKDEGRQRLDVDKDLRDKPSSSSHSDIKHAALPPKPESHGRRGKAPQLSEEERAARLREMQMDAEIHEENRWKRLKKAEEEDAKEASKATVSRGSSFLDAVQKSVYGAEKGGSSTIEESVRRRSHFSQGRTQVDEQNAFRR